MFAFAGKSLFLLSQSRRDVRSDERKGIHLYALCGEKEEEEERRGREREREEVKEEEEEEEEEEDRERDKVPEKTCLFPYRENNFSKRGKGGGGVAFSYPHHSLFLSLRC